MALTPVYNNPPPIDLATLPPAKSQPDEVLILPVEGDHPTANPDGVTNSIPDYYPKSQEEKAELLGVQFATPVELGPDEPYIEQGEMSGFGAQADEEQRLAMLHRVHSPMELVAGDDRLSQQEANLKAGGSVEGSNPGPTLADMQRDEGSPGTRPGGGSVA